MSLFVEQAAFFADICRLQHWASERGYLMAGRELARTPEQQAIYLKSGRSTTMASNHLRSCALDAYFMKAGKLLQTKEELLPLGIFWCSLDPKNQWGGFWASFQDCPHFERRP